jgi:hypothetical protein
VKNSFAAADRESGRQSAVPFKRLHGMTEVVPFSNPVLLLLLWRPVGNWKARNLSLLLLLLHL